MNIGIVELGDARHYTYVEAFAKVFSVPRGNRVFLFSDAKGKQELEFLTNEQIAVIELDTTGAANVFQQIAQWPLDKIYIVTLEAYAKSSFKLTQQLLETPLNYELNYVVHNIDFWFQQSLGNKLNRVFGGSKSISEFFFNGKTNFYYSLWNRRILKKVLDSGGKLVVLSESVARELANFMPEKNIAIVPFSIYDGSIKDLSGSNKRIRICLPGYVSAIRRDYLSVLDLLKNDKIRDAVELDFLGGIATLDGGDKIVAAAKDWIAKGASIHLYEKPSVDIGEFDQNLAKADIILGNLHVRVGPLVQYGRSKESGLLFTMVKSAKPGMVPAPYPVESALLTSVITFENYRVAQSILIDLIDNPERLVGLKSEALKNAAHYSPVKIYNRIVKTGPAGQLS